MKKKIIVAVVLLVILAGAIFAYIALKDENLDANNKNIDSEQVSKEINEQSNPDGSWKISAGDDVFAGYQINEVFGGQSITKTAVGKSTAIKGTLKIDGKTISGVQVNIDMTKVKSDSSGRDDSMGDDGLQTDTFKTAKFEQTKDFEFETVPSKGETVSIAIVGELTLHGVTKEITFTLSATWDGKTIKASGEQEINLPDYAISAPDSSFVKVETMGLIKLQLLFIPA